MDTVKTLRFSSKKAEAVGWKHIRQILGIWIDKAAAEGRINYKKDRKTQKKPKTPAPSFWVSSKTSNMINYARVLNPGQ